MNIRSLKPAADFARQYGVKTLIYGPPGSAKTPSVNTAPRPVLLACEPGMLSMRGSNVPTWEAFTVQKINEFFDWFLNSNENKNFDTLAIDSGSQLADIYLQDALKNNKHGLKAYGDMLDDVMVKLRQIYFLPQKHIYILAKEQTFDDKGMKSRRPFFPGQQLPIEVPHLFDFVLRLAMHNIPGMGATRAYRCNQSLDEAARNRTGNLNEFEPPDFGKLVLKAMG